jgi:hypothetical protein
MLRWLLRLILNFLHFEPTASPSAKRGLSGIAATAGQYAGLDGHTYRFFSVATDHVGHEQPTPAGAQAIITVDTTPPTVNDGVATDIAFQVSNTAISANWSGFNDAGSGIADYQLAIGTTVGGTEVQSFASVGFVGGATVAGLNLLDGVKYYVSVRAIDGGGNINMEARSDGVTVDSTAPNSAVQALPAFSVETFTIHWSGSDAGSGIGSFDVFVSDNNAAFTLFQNDTTQTSSVFIGQNGHIYRFFCVATDNVRNVQVMSAGAQASTQVDAIAPIISVAALPAFSMSSFTVSWSGSEIGGAGVGTFDIYKSENGGPFTLFQNDTTATEAIFNGVPGFAYAFYSVATDAVGNQEAIAVSADAQTRTALYQLQPNVQVAEDVAAPASVKVSGL